MNWDNITYIFQIPIEWYKEIHQRVFGAYGTNFIRVRDGDDGAMQIDVDENTFAQAVNQYASGTVKSVNNESPDANGNVDLGKLVKSVNTKTPDANGNVTINVGTVASVNDKGPDQNGNVDLGPLVHSVNNIVPVNGNVNISSITMQDVQDYITDQNFVNEDTLNDYALTSDLADYALTSDLADYALTSDLADYAHTVDGHQAVNGVVNFDLGASKWMKTDASGHIATTNETPIFLSAGDTGYLYANNGSLQFKNDEYVTLSTQQDISGKKRFMQNDVTIVDNSLLVVDSQTNNGTSVSKNGVTINSSTPFIDFSTPGTAANDTFIAMTAASGYKLGINSPHGIDLDAPVNEAKLAIQPTDTTTASLAIATCGYVQSQLSGYTSAETVKILADVSWDGTTLKKKFTNFDIKKGLITNVIQSPTWITIDTPVAYTP